MMKTRDRILKKSQELFNKNGIRKVSVRNICEELKISLGNFTYYFPDKQKIIAELYYKMIAEIEAIAADIITNPKGIEFLLEYHGRVFKIQNRFKFFFLNTFELINNSDEIRNAYIEHVGNEKKMMKSLLESYIKNGVVKIETDPQFLERLIKVSLMVNSFWIIDAEMFFKGKKNQKLIHYLELCCSLIEPHLTDIALKEYRDYLNKKLKEIKN